MQPVAIAQDRSISVPPGHIVKTGYVHVDQVKMACRERMAIGDVNTAYQKRLQLGENQSWPPPRGHWEGERFVVEDGRHEYLATLMLGHQYLFVAWLELAA